MASKKGKKSKGVTMSLHEFTTQGTGAALPRAGQNIVYADKKPTMSSWADELEDDIGFEKEMIILPSGPRASRGLPYEDHEIPRQPPFTAHLGNLSYDVSEDDVYDFFRELDLQNLHLPLDQQTQRLRGFGYAEFGSRDGLIEALHLSDTKMRGRPVRITLGTGKQDRRGGDMGMRGGDGDRRGGRPLPEDDGVDDWRSVMNAQGFDGPRGAPSGDYNSLPRSGRGGFRDRGFGGGGGGGGFRDRGFGGGDGFRDRGFGGGPPRGPPEEEEIEFSRSEMVQGPPPSAQNYSNYNTYPGRSGGQRGGGYSRDRGDEQEGESDWRRPEPTDSQSSQYSSRYPAEGNALSPPRSERRERSESPPVRQNLHQRDRTMTSSDPDRDDCERGNRGHEHEEYEAAPPRPQAPKERRRLVLQPRTVDKPLGQNEAVSSSIFGGAKPVDTQRREREIEEKLEKLKVEEEPSTTEGNKSLDSTPEADTDGGEPGLESVSGGDARDEHPRGVGSENADRGESSYRGGRDEGPRRGDWRDEFEDRRRGADFRRDGGGDRYEDRRDGGDNFRRGGGFGDQRRGDDFRRGGRGDRDRRGEEFRRGGRGDGDRRLDDFQRGSRGDGERRGGDFQRGDRRDGDRRGDHFHREGQTGGFGDRRGGEDFRRGGEGDRHGGQRDDFRRGPYHHEGVRDNNQFSSPRAAGSRSEERDCDSHSEPEDDRDMMRGGGGAAGGGGEASAEQRENLSDDDAGFTRVENRRGYQSYNRRNNNQMSSRDAGSDRPRRGGSGPNSD